METQPNQLAPEMEHLKEQHVTILALGDSNTQQMHWTYGHCNWVGLLSMGLYSLFPQGATVINSGRSGDSMAGGLARLERDVLRFDPDIVLIGYGSNDCVKVTPEVFQQQVIEAIRRIRAHNPQCVIILRTTVPVVNQYTGEEEAVYESGGQQVTSELRAHFVSKLRLVAEQEQTLLVDHYALWKASMQSSCRGDLCALMGNPVHPNHLGHRRLYHEIAQLFNSYPYFFHDWQRVLRDQDLPC
ncbi:SGNH/GDSL hydrolase family protein [Coraliomargarita algicola]|uniref:SGNH/GDSL hydrolase family protein n=1 Tax=Coraliomargarita algicola TaxID=3092156 RepID=A0ABZ0RPS2_9BACT|nr:SGNH/GDSL hydrolase family protein [Coraliomargarita sp. J2-16]WPJ96740.1 SGNH/GDSL hydrolase family protein [Coraliomargarita sp. J2-16]